LLTDAVMNGISLLKIKVVLKSRVLLIDPIIFLNGYSPNVLRFAPIILKFTADVPSVPV
jgi:hypothetical protein